LVMHKRIGDLTDHYNQLIQIMRKQYAIVQQEPDTESLNDFGVLSTEFSILAAKVDAELALLGGYEGLPAESRHSIEASLQNMLSLGNDIERQMEFWYQNDSSTMKKIKMQQTTLRSYGGVNNSDSVALYIDEKK